MANAVTDLERMIQLRSWRDELVLSAAYAREKGYLHTADALDKILRDEMDQFSLDARAVGISVGRNSKDDYLPSPDTTDFAEPENTE